MCGIIGFINPLGSQAVDAKNSLSFMRDHLVHRGPDDGGIWLDADAGIALGHRRLSVLDLSSEGHQPMVSLSRRFVLVYNGEIYNHLYLRDLLRSTFDSWRGQSDTETLLVAIECWGFKKALQATVGMFALALWDRQERKLLIARDRMGEKPFYYGWQKGVLLFGSELKALRAHPAFKHEIDRAVIPLYLRHGYIPAPWSIYKGIRKLLPGTWVSFSTKDHDQMPEPRPYWSLTDVVLNGQSNPFKGSEDEAVNELDRRLNQSIAGQSLADVPLGAFLSGGVDSSTVIALMQTQSSRPVKTFTIGFDETGYDEAVHAKAVAKYLGTDHTELYVTSAQAQQVIPKLSQIYDEPFGDSSGIPTHLVSQLARAHVTVSLSGDGGDELFGGYSRYSGFQRWQKRMASVPSPLRTILSDGLSLISDLGNTRNQRRLALLSGISEAKHPAALYRSLTSHWLPRDGAAQNAEEALYWLTDRALRLNLNELIDHALLADMMTYLPDDILVKVDRASMAVSLETRTPMLDHRIVEWSWSLPQSLKARGAHQKWVLRELLYRYVPKALIERPKMGFGVPIGSWLRGPLKEWAEELLSTKCLVEGGFHAPNEIRMIWKQHLEGKGDYRDMLWIILMWQAFLSNTDSEFAG